MKEVGRVGDDGYSGTNVGLQKDANNRFLNTGIHMFTSEAG